MVNIKNKHKVRVEGLNMHHLIAFLENSQFEIENLSRIDHSTIEFILPKKQLNQFKKTDMIKTFKLTTIKTYGPLNILKLFLNKLGLITGIIICLSFMLNSFSTISNVVIEQTNHSCSNGKDCIFNPDNQVKLLQVLESQGIKIGLNLKSMPSNKQLEQVLISEFEQVSGVTLSKRGSVVNVKIIEGHLKSPLSEDLISPVNGIILSCESTCGTLKVKPGDLVLKDQILVEKQNNKEICANIQIRTFYHDSMIYDSDQTSYVKTGNKHNVSTISLFGKTFGNSTSSKFKLFETSIKNNYAFLNLFCPISIQITTYYELETIKNNIPFAEVEENLKNELLEKTRLFLENNAIEKKHSFTTFTEGSRTRLDCYIEAIIEIKK